MRLQEQLDSPTTLVERDEPLATLHSLAELASTGRGCIALVRGEAGIGKTTLLRAFKQRLDSNFQVNWGACDPLLTPRVLGPIHDMSQDFSIAVQQLLRIDTALTQLVPAILEDLELGSSPTIMIFEDCHWADNATLDLLRCVGRRISFLNVLLIISYRDDEVDPKHALTELLGDFPQPQTHRIELDPLSPDGVERLAEIHGQKIEGLHQLTSGNPFYITEFLASSCPDTAAVPASVQNTIGSRLNRLPNELQFFLETICLVPYAISVDLLNALVGKNAESLADNCVQRKFLIRNENNTLKFRHELARLGTKERVSQSDQKAIHEKILRALDESAGSVASYQFVFHAASAGLGNRVLELAPQAARSASTRGAHREAASHLATALKYVDDAPMELAASLYENWAYESGLVSVDQETIEARHKALLLWRKLDRPDKIGDNLRWLSRLHWYRGEADEAHRFLDEAVYALEDTEPSSERAMAYSLKSQFYMLNDRMDDSIIWGNKALEIEKSFNNVEVKIHACNNIGTAMLFRDELAGLNYLKKSLALSLEHQLHEHAARVYTNLSDYAVGARNFALAETTIADGLVFDSSHDLDAWTHYLTGLLAQLRMEQGRLEEAETIAQGVMDLDNQTLLMKLPAQLVLSKTRARLGKPNAIVQLENALLNALSTAEVQYILPARLSMIEYSWLSSDQPAAIAQLESLLLLDSTPMGTWRGAEIAMWLHRFGMTSKANSSAELPTPYQLECDGKYMEAADAWLQLESPFQAALSLMSKKDTEVLSEFTRAFELLENMFASAGILKLKQLAKSRGIVDKLPFSKRGPRKSSRQHPLGLTDKEQELIPYIVEGLSNKEISNILSRSPRTVENHIASIFRKMNVKNRMGVMLRIKNEPWLVSKEKGASRIAVLS